MLHPLEGEKLPFSDSVIPMGDDKFMTLVVQNHGTAPADYWRLNHLTKVDEFPLPRIDDTLDLLSGNRYFTTLDLASGNWQVRMKHTSKEKTAFTTCSELYHFNKMPFGLVNAPATFQQLMEVVLSNFAWKRCVVYLDDMIFRKTLEEHNENRRCVLERIQKAGLRLKLVKCQITCRKVEYLGHIVSVDGGGTDRSLKLDAVKWFPVPSDTKALHSFLGLPSYYQ